MGAVGGASPLLSQQVQSTIGSFIRPLFSFFSPNLARPEYASPLPEGERGPAQADRSAAVWPEGVAFCAVVRGITCPLKPTLPPLPL